VAVRPVLGSIRASGRTDQRVIEAVISDGSAHVFSGVCSDAQLALECGWRIAVESSADDQSCDVY
jgi:hypothetical protein